MNNLVALRRRGYGKEDDMVIQIIHPDMQYFEETTTEENQKIYLFYAGGVNRFILDGVEMTSGFGYDNSAAFGYVIVPTPGLHQIYAGQSNPTDWNGAVTRYYGTGLLRPKRYTRQLQNPPSGKITGLILLRDTPPDQGGSGSLSGLLSNVDKVFVPKNAVSAFKEHWQWKNVASKIKGVVFDIIED